MRGPRDNAMMATVKAMNARAKANDTRARAKAGRLGLGLEQLL